MNKGAISPEISVVMSVYNGECSLERTMNSILQQSFPNFEFIIIDDGSTDLSLAKLREYEARDPRIRVITQQNLGLTAALNVGCAQAIAPVIARQDMGDISLPDRLRTQWKYLNQHFEVVAVGCGARRVTERGEFLGITGRNASPEEITRQLVGQGTGILHAASMFRKCAFDRIGGYRTQFRFAQDTDLWLRMSDIGLIGESSDVLFEVIIDDHGISASRINQQVALWKLARECAETRRRGESELELLKAAERVSQSVPAILSPKARDWQNRKARYFIGSQLYDLGNSACRRYLKDSLCVPSLLLPSAAKILMSFAKCRQQ